MGCEQEFHLSLLSYKINHVQFLLRNLYRVKRFEVEVSDVLRREPRKSVNGLLLKREPSASLPGFLHPRSSPQPGWSSDCRRLEGERERAPKG